MRSRLWFLAFSLAVVFLSVQCRTFKESAGLQNYNFEPTGESLKNYKVPRWNETEKGLELILPMEAPCDYAFVLKIVPKGKLLFEKE